MRITGLGDTSYNNYLNRHLEEKKDQKDLFDLDLNIEAKLTQENINHPADSDCTCSDSAQCSACGCRSVCSSC